MRKRDREVSSPKRRDWPTLFLLGMFTFVYGLLKLMTGRTIYQNWFHNPVFAPFVALIGILAMVGALVLRHRKS